MVNLELKEAGELKPVKRPVLVLTIGLDGEETPYQLAIGDPTHKVTKAEPWMIEACMVGIDVLQGALQKLSSSLLTNLVRQGQLVRQKEKEIKEVWAAQEQEKGREN